MNVPVNCISCGTQIYANVPIEESKCKKCIENERYKNALYALLYMADEDEIDMMVDIIIDALGGYEMANPYKKYVEKGKYIFLRDYS